MLAAVGTLGVGLAVLTTLTLIGWMAAPRGPFGEGLPGVFRTACQLWLAAHHAGFAIPGGRVGLLPIGLMILPGVLLYRAGLWMARDADLRVRMPARLPKGTPRDVENARRRAQLALIAQAGISLAAPYALLAGVIALVSGNEIMEPFLGEALVSHLLLAFVTGSVATARTIGPWRSMLRLLPERPRSLVAGTAVATALMLVAGAVLVLAAVVVNFARIQQMSEVLSPGVVGGLLLLLLEVLYFFNAVIWGMAYISGPGFAVGAGTLVAPTGVKLSAVPMLPLLGALPSSGAAPPWVMSVIAVPFAAGAVSRRGDGPRRADPFDRGRAAVGVRLRDHLRARRGNARRAVGRPARRGGPGRRGAVPLGGGAVGHTGGRRGRRDLGRHRQLVADLPASCHPARAGAEGRSRDRQGGRAGAAHTRRPPAGPLAGRHRGRHPADPGHQGRLDRRARRGGGGDLRRHGRTAGRVRIPDPREAAQTGAEAP